MGGVYAWRLECTDSILSERAESQNYPQYCWEFHDRLWEALSGTTSEKRGVPSRTGGERILEMLWKPQMPSIIGFGASQPYSWGEFQETLWERFRGLSGTLPEFLPESPSRTGGTAQKGAQERAEVLRTILPSPPSHIGRHLCKTKLTRKVLNAQTLMARKRAEYGFGEYGFKHRTQWVFWGSLSSGERTQWVPLSLLFVCQSELTEFFAELTEFALKLSEFSSPKQYSWNSIPPVS